ncbi:response regulator [Paenibacillus sp. MMS20-IR301]|uniref:LytR/AlgR family response regulator transcription factor n=1 Tax=Paenibacillus sp. MMS20-IR301 TaxID=2895946 RepID=UPI0028E5F540|nr:response regulator [Paenibacillus sp. MMS20-IR301]WNS46255.1 response regulator [Paenibacillus sp. MMS20-IR301]
MIKAFLLDVNQKDLYKLSSMLQRTGKVSVIGMSVHAQNVTDRIALLRPDVLFLDLQLPGMQGVIIAEYVKKQLPEIQIVVVTESKQHALWAFDQNIADYLMKPLEEVRLGHSLERLRKGCWADESTS